MSQVPDALTELLRSQHGAVTRAQALAAGLSVSSLRTELRNRRWRRAAPAVYALAGHRRSWAQDLWVAHLSAGEHSCISHESAAQLHHIDEVPQFTVVVTVPHSQRRTVPNARVHRVDDLEPLHVTLLDGLPVTTLPRTVIDLAGVLHIARLRLLLERCLVERRIALAELGAMLDGLRRRGKPGIARLSRVLDELGPGDGIPNGELERMFTPVLELSGLPEPVHEHPLPGVGPRSGFVDRCWPDARLIVEIDGRKWHTRRHQVLADHDRVLQAQAAGFDTVRLLWEHIVHDAATTAATLRSIHDRRITDAAER